MLSIMRKSKYKNKTRGILVGLATGDALGAPIEFGHNSAGIRANWGGLMQDHRIPKGHYTDDTAMALCLADSLLECGGYNSYDVMVKYLKWSTQGYRDSENKPAADIGIQTAHAIEFFVNTPVIPTYRERLTSAGNGGIMRMAPAVIVSYDEPIDKAMKLARLSSRETHYSHEADAGAEIFAAMLHRALAGDKKEKVINVGSLTTGEYYDSVMQRVAEAHNKDYEPNLIDLGGYVVDALKVAVWGFLHFDSFEDGMIAVIGLGGDTDTNAAIYGQLAGAYYGLKAIPAKWLDELYMYDEMIELADRLAQERPSKIIQTRFEEDEEYFVDLAI